VSEVPTAELLMILKGTVPTGVKVNDERPLDESEVACSVDDRVMPENEVSPTVEMVVVRRGYDAVPDTDHSVLVLQSTVVVCETVTVVASFGSSLSFRPAMAVPRKIWKDAAPARRYLRIRIVAKNSFREA
jgi:hypothetical protein